MLSWVAFDPTRESVRENWQWWWLWTDRRQRKNCVCEIFWPLFLTQQIKNVTVSFSPDYLKKYYWCFICVISTWNNTRTLLENISQALMHKHRNIKIVLTHFRNIWGVTWVYDVIFCGTVEVKKNTRIMKREIKGVAVYVLELCLGFKCHPE